MGASDEQLPFRVEWRNDGFVVSMDDPVLAPNSSLPGQADIRSTLVLYLGMAILLLPLPIAGVTSSIVPDMHVPAMWALGYWLLAMPAALLALHLFTSRPLRAVLDCGPERVAISRTLRWRQSLDTRRITEVIPVQGGLYIATDGRRVWIPCPDEHLEELVDLLEETLRRYSSFQEDMEQPEVVEASRHARSILAGKRKAERE